MATMTILSSTSCALRLTPALALEGLLYQAARGPDQAIRYHATRNGISRDERFELLPQHWRGHSGLAACEQWKYMLIICKLFPCQGPMQEGVDAGGVVSINRRQCQPQTPINATQAIACTSTHKGTRERYARCTWITPLSGSAQHS